MSGTPDKREQILEAGGEVLYRQGYNATGVKDVVDAAGIPKGSFYNYFQSKQHFALEVLDCIAAAQLERLLATLTDPGRSPRERLRGFFTQYVEAKKVGADFSRGCIIGNLTQEMADHSPEIAARTEHWFERYVAAIGNCLREGQRSGEVSAELDADELAEFVFNSWEGAVLRMKASRSPAPLDNFLRHLEVIVPPA